jgi:hypothetical protein
MRHWDFLVAQRAWCVKMGLLLFAAALVTAVLQVWKPLEMPIAVLLATWAMWMFSTHQLLGQLANQQARIDMMLVGQGKEPE